VLAYVEPGGAIRVTQATSGPPLWRVAGGPTPAQLEWSSDGRALLALYADRLVVLGRGGEVMATYVLPRGSRAESAAFGRLGRSIALVSRSEDGTSSRLTLLRLRGSEISERLLLSAAGRFGRLAWSPNGRWLLAAWPTADQWLFIRVSGETGPPGRVVTVSGVSGQFDPAGAGAPASPVPGGWCCRP
jgi:hypothetical protein